MRRISLCTIVVLSLFYSCIKKDSDPNKKNAVYQPSFSVRTYVDQGIPSQPTDENKSEDCQPGFYRDLETDICVEDIEPKDLKY